VPERHVESVFDYEVNVFTYQAVGLPDLKADDYQTIDNPLGPALSALMKTSRLGKVAQKYHSLRAMARSRVDEARKALLTNVVETYLTLEADEQAAFQELVSTSEGEEVSEMISIYEQRGIEKGIEQGIGRGKRDTLLGLLHHKFGELPDNVRAHVEAVTDIGELDRLTYQVLLASTLEEMRL
jgi:hypothetical protein